MVNLLDDSEITGNLSDLEVSSSDGHKSLGFANELPPELLVYIFEIAQNMLPPSERLFRHFPLVLGMSRITGDKWRLERPRYGRMWISRILGISLFYELTLTGPRTILLICI